MRRLDLPPVYLLAAAAFMLLLQRWLPVLDLIGWPWRWLGLVPIAAGIALTIAGERAFARAGTAVVPFREPSALVTGGPFAFTRNPMYLGMVACLIGWALLLGSLSPFLVIPLFFALIHYRFVLREEPFMTERLGAAYIAYKARVRRWL